MKVWYKINKKSKTSGESSIRGFALKTAAITVAIGGSIIFAHVGVNAAESSDAVMKDYCKKFTVVAQNTACTDGWQGKDCEEYKQFAPENKKICDEAGAFKEKSVKDGNISTDDKSGTDGTSGTDKTCSSSTGSTTGTNKSSSSSTSTTSGTGSSTTNSACTTDKSSSGSSSGSSSTYQAKPKVNPDSVPDNNYGAYVNGAANLQPIRVNKASGSNRPAIVFINGGGWHSDDGVGDKVRPWANERGYTTFVATYRLGSSGIYYMLDDVMRAMRHIRNNAGMYGIDPNRIAIFGDSAGGSLALRAAGTGLSGARVAVGWSAPTNAYTGIFASARSFAIGMDHSTCVPTDLNGISSVVDQLNGGSGTDPKTGNDGGLGNNGTSGLTGDGLVTSVLEVAAQAQKTGQSAEAISKNLETEEGQKKLGENARRLAVKKFIECIDNFNSASPALFASALSPPAFLAGYDTDPLVHPDQAYQMRDKLRSLGVASEALILPGAPTDAVGSAIGTETPGENHLDYNEKFVKPTLDFVDKFLHPEE